MMVMEIEDFLQQRKALYLVLLRQHGKRIIEVTGQGYTRQPILVGVNFEQVSPGLFINSRVVSFGPALNKWGFITQAMYCDSPENGIFLANAGLLNIDLKQGGSITIQPGGLQLTVHSENESVDS